MLLRDGAHFCANQPSALTGKRILFPGSSVTYGAACEGQSFVEFFHELDGVQVTKEAISGMTLVDCVSTWAEHTYGNGDKEIRNGKRNCFQQ